MSELFEYEEMYELDFAVGFDYSGGKVTKTKEVVTKFKVENTNLTEDKPMDILKIVVNCKDCGRLMKYKNGKGWVDGGYFCEKCGARVEESVPLSILLNESLGIKADLNKLN